MNVELIPTDKVDQVWPLVAKGFADCLKKTPTDIPAGEFWTMCRSGHAFLIVCHDGAIAAASVWRFQGEYFNCLLMYGENAANWTQNLFDFAAEMARLNGSTAIRATGRMGLLAMLKKSNIPARAVRQTLEVRL